MTFLLEIRSALRSFRREPAFAILAVLTLGVGLGGTTAIFSALQAVLLRPLPYPEPEALAAVYTTYHGENDTSSPPDFYDLRASNQSFTEMAAFNANSVTLSGEGEPEQIPSAEVTGGFFSVLGRAPLLGRTMDLDDDQPGNKVVVISHQLWQRRFGGDSAVVGQTIRLDASPYTVLGVMPPSFRFPLGAEVWTPAGFTPEDLRTQRGAQFLQVVGRVRPGVTLAAAQADLETITARLRAIYPRNEHKGAAVEPLRQAIVGTSERPLQLLLGAVGLVLLIACSNVAGLLLARAMARHRESAVRIALGASRLQLARQVLIESLLLGLLGGMVAILCAVWGAAAIAGIRATDIPLLDQTRIDGWVLAFATGLAVASGLLAGLVPAWRATAANDLTMRIKEGRAAPSRQRSRTALVVVELALALVLVVGSGLLLQSFAHLVTADLGFRQDGIQTVAITLPSERYRVERRPSFMAGLLEQLRRLPGVRATGAVFGLPLTGFGYSISTSVLDGRQLELEQQQKTILAIRVVTPDYFRAMGVSLRSGRFFGDRDRDGAPAVAMVNESAARLLWPGQAPLGHSVLIGTRLSLGRDRPRVGGEVVGVVPDYKESGPEGPTLPTLFVPYAQAPVGDLSIVVRTDGPPAALVAPIRQVLASADPDLAPYRERSIEQLLGDSIARQRLYAVLVTAFAAVALVLAGVGIFGVMMTLVTQRTHEFGIRMAIGALPARLLLGVLGDGVRLMCLGLLVGLAGALAGVRVLQALLYQVSPADPLVLTGAVAALSAAVLLACLVPAWRASKVDPLTALRSE